MPKFFFDAQNIINNKLTLIDENYKHIARVLRHKVGDVICLCDGCGYDYKAIIDEITTEEIHTTITDKYKNNSESEIKITLFQGLPKSDKLEYIIMKCTELGVAKVIPVESQYSVSRITAENLKKKLERWNKIAFEASKQSQRGEILKVESPMQFKNAADVASGYDLFIIAYELESEVKLKEILKKYNKPKNIAVFIGPEGGFALDEVEYAMSKGAKSVTLGNRILRTETAGIALVSMALYEYDQI